MRRTVGRLLLAIAAGLVGLLALGTAAGAHTSVVGTVPTNGATVTSIDYVVIRFAGPVETNGAHIWIEGPNGAAALGPASSVDGNLRSIEVPVGDLETGSYQVGFHIVAADGDVLAGSFGFAVSLPAVGGPPAAPARVTPPPHVDHPGQVGTGIARVVLDASLASLIGGVAFVATVWPQGSAVAATRRLLWGAVIAAALASLVLVVVQHAAAAGIGVFDALAPRHLAGALGYQFGRIAVVRVALLVAAALLTGRLHSAGTGFVRSRQWSAAAIAVAVGLFETVVLLGHQGSDPLSAASRFAHAIGVSVWLGGLVMLLTVVLPRRRTEDIATEDIAEVLRRFSNLATGAVALLVAGGIVLAVDLVGASDVLPTTTYGRTLAVKVAVVAGLLVVASYARRSVRDRLASPHSRVYGPIAAAIGVELALIACVFGVTAVLLAQAPPS